ncbi:glycosyltransferase family 4 protein [Halobellus inordinatus]|uniref:glycosyltransferase family 4 protein n=1 Tax=Halobellus inordinatus TaxID=1126236 RepID=UPI0021145220|nr:glycosyltransferase family 4 protein [Halobellus ramosii]
MKVLVITWRDLRHSRSGGEERFLHEICSRLVDRGVNVTMLCCGGEGLPSEENRDGITIHRVGSLYTFFPRVPLAYKRLARRDSFDVVIENITAVPVFTPLYVGSRLTAIEHHITDHIFFEELPAPLGAVAWLAERSIPLFYRSVPFLTVSASTRAELEQMGLYVRSVVHNGIDDTLLMSDSGENFDTNTSDDGHRLLYLGRVRRHKHIDDVVSVVKRLRGEFPNLQLDVAGTGDHLGELRTLVTEWGLNDRVTFHGFVDKPTKRRLLAQADLFCIASRKEGWGITVIEANAQGTPVVGYDVPGLRDSVIDGETGVLCKPSVESMTNAVRELLQNDKLRQSLGENARNHAEEYTWSQASDTFHTAVFGDRNWNEEEKRDASERVN